MQIEETGPVGSRGPLPPRPPSIPPSPKRERFIRDLFKRAPRQNRPNWRAIRRLKGELDYFPNGILQALHDFGTKVYVVRRKESLISTGIAPDFAPDFDLRFHHPGFVDIADIIKHHLTDFNKKFGVSPKGADAEEKRREIFKVLGEEGNNEFGILTLGKNPSGFLVRLPDVEKRNLTLGDVVEKHMGSRDDSHAKQFLTQIRLFNSNHFEHRRLSTIASTKFSSLKGSCVVIPSYHRVSRNLHSAEPDQGEKLYILDEWLTRSEQWGRVIEDHPKKGGFYNPEINAGVLRDKRTRLEDFSFESNLVHELGHAFRAAMAELNRPAFNFITEESVKACDRANETQLFSIFPGQREQILRSKETELFGPTFELFYYKDPSGAARTIGEHDPEWLAAFQAFVASAE